MFGWPLNSNNLRKKFFAVRTFGQQRCHNQAIEADGEFEDDPLPKTVEENLRRIDSEMEFLKNEMSALPMPINREKTYGF